MIRHIAVFRWKPASPTTRWLRSGRALSRLPAVVSTIRRYEHGPDAGFGTPRWDYAVVAEFDDVAGWRAYDEHPDHDRVRREVISPLAEERATIQLRV